MVNNNSNTSKKSTSSYKQFSSSLKTSAKDKLASISAEKRQDILDSIKALNASKTVRFSSIADIKITEADSQQKATSANQPIDLDDDFHRDINKVNVEIINQDRRNIIKKYVQSWKDEWRSILTHHIKRAQLAIMNLDQDVVETLTELQDPYNLTLLNLFYDF